MWGAPASSFITFYIYMWPGMNIIKENKTLSAQYKQNVERNWFRSSICGVWLGESGIFKMKDALKTEDILANKNYNNEGKSSGKGTDGRRAFCSLFLTCTRTYKSEQKKEEEEIKRREERSTSRLAWYWGLIESCRIIARFINFAKFLENHKMRLNLQMLITKFLRIFRKIVP